MNLTKQVAAQLTRWGGVINLKSIISVKNIESTCNTLVTCHQIK